MRTRAINQSETEYLQSRLIKPYKDIIDSTIVVSVLSIFVLILLAWLTQSLFPEIDNGQLKLIVVSISSIVGFTFLLTRIRKRKSMEKLIRECVVEEIGLTIKRFAKKSVSNTELTCYLCDCPEQGTAYFQTEQYLQKGLNAEIIISVAKLDKSEKSILLSVRNDPSTGKADRTKNVKIPKELLDYEYKLIDSPFESFIKNK